MKSWINYQHLFYFKTIAQEGSISKAAKKLLLAQPTLSAQLKQFEENIGVKLFERQHKKIILTEHGKIALDYASNLFKIGNEMLEVLHDQHIGKKATVHIGSLDSVPKQIILQIVQKILSQSPCHIILSEGKSEELLAELKNHKIDILVSNFLPIGSNAKSLFTRLITKKQVAFYGSSKFKQLKKNYPRSLSLQPIIMPTYDSRLRQDIENWALSNKIELNIVVESQDISMKKLLAQNHIGILPTATHTVISQIQKKQIYQIGVLKNVYEELYLISASRKIENNIASNIMQNFSA